MDRARRHRPRHLALPPRAFTLIELLAVIAVVGVLSSLLLPALARSKGKARDLQCLANLHHLALAGQMFWDDHEGQTFPFRKTANASGDPLGVVYWFGWLERTHSPEGHRRFDPRQAALFPYLQDKGVEICPSLNYSMRQFKTKATGAAYGYGYNLHLARRPSSSEPVNVRRIHRASQLVFLGDAAQVNTFQPPASPDHPMLEEFYYLSRFEPTAHFRHQSKCQAAFVDGHVSAESPTPNSLDPRLPNSGVGRLPDSLLEPH